MPISRGSSGGSSVTGFDPEGLERAAKAARDLDSSRNASAAIELIKTQETTKQHEAAAKRAPGYGVTALGMMANNLVTTATTGNDLPKLGNEAAYLLQKLMRSLVGSNNIDHKGGAAVLADPRGLANIRDVESADVIVLAGVDLAQERGGHVDHPDPPVVGGGHETGQIRHHADRGGQPYHVHARI